MDSTKVRLRREAERKIEIKENRDKSSISPIKVNFSSTVVSISGDPPIPITQNTEQLANTILFQKDGK